MNARTAVITGITGQDGGYLAELLLAEGYHVVGLGRDSTGGPRHDRLLRGCCDLTDTHALEEILREHRPAEVYNLAAMSSGAGMFDEAVRIGEVNGLAVARILEAIRRVDPRIRFCQASSSELFGNALASPQCEDTPPRPRSPYGAAKLYADSMVRIYRERYGMFACSAILFNHESPRRRLEFVSRKVTHAAASIKLRIETELVLGSLDARRDWGFAGDYVRAMWLMLQHPYPQDYVIATGQTHSVRDLCSVAFGHLGLDYRDFVRESTDRARTPELVALVGDACRARRELNWSPRVSFQQMVTDMVDSDLRAIQDRLFGKVGQQ